MRLLSVEQAAQQARLALVRFPFALLSAVLCALIALAMIQSPGTDSVLLRMLLSATLGLPLFTALEALAERRGWNTRLRLGTAAGGVGVLLLFRFAAGSWSDTLLWTHYVQLGVALHLMVAVLPFGGNTTLQGFWQYNRVLFLRYLLAALYTVVLFAALALALLALDHLFGVHVRDRAYEWLWVLLAFIFHPWFFLGGMPADLAALEQRSDYPGGLKIFAQFILIPVVSVYLLILTAYLVRVIVTHTWPSGWIGYLVSGVAAAGTLALLLVHPLRERADNRWVDVYGRWFYVALLPSVAMLLMAIGQRINQYGFTERRYFLCVLAVWLALIALYYGARGSRNIRIIPVTLCLVALLTMAGPWSAYHVSATSQATRLRAIMMRNGLLVNEQVVRATRDVPWEDRREISGTVRYLTRTHGQAALALASPELRAAAAQGPPEPEKGLEDPIERAVLDRMGVAYVTRWQAQPSEYLTFYSDPSGEPLDVAGYDVLLRTSLARPFSLPLGGDSLSFTYDTSPPLLHVTRGGQPVMSVAMSWVLPALEEATRATPQPGSHGMAPLTLSLDSAGVRVRLLLTSITGRKTEAGGVELTLLEAVVLVGR